MLQRGTTGRYPGVTTPLPDMGIRRNGHLLNGDATREGTPRVAAKLPETFKPVLPTSLAAASSLDLLSQAEQTLCANLQILPKAYLVIKDTLLRENARRGGLLLRKEARKLLKVDTVKVGKIFDYLRASGMLLVRKPSDPDTNEATRTSGEDALAAASTARNTNPLPHPTANGTPSQT